MMILPHWRWMLSLMRPMNPYLAGGVLAGPQLLEECRTLNGCLTGQAKITQGYQLPAKYVIHTVGPVWHGGQNNEADLLLALENKLKTIAFPAISCGVFRYPIFEAAKIAAPQRDLPPLIQALMRFILWHFSKILRMLIKRHYLNYNNELQYYLA